MGGLFSQRISNGDVYPEIELLRLMASSREGDRRQSILVRQGRGWFDLPGSGHEALAAIAPHFHSDDLLFPHYRDRALVMALGVSNYELALSFFARRDSYSGGRQMTSFFSSATRGIMSIAAPVGSQCLPAVGAAQARQREEKGIVICCLGDATTRQGEFFEALCFAQQEKLPIVFVVEDNGYGISTPTAKITPPALGLIPEHIISLVEGWDVRAVYNASGDAIEKARRGEGPSLLWLKLARLCSHTSADDQRLYRPLNEMESLPEHDPVQHLLNQFYSSKRLTIEEWKKEEAAIASLVTADYEEAELAAIPEQNTVMCHLFSPIAPPPMKPCLESRNEWTMAEAINETLFQSLEKNEKMLMFGQDIEDPKGGVFGLTKGLSTHFATRVQNSPLAEATIVGTGIGLALSGYKPVFELQFVDFFAPGFNQIVTQMATLRWRTQGEWRCPLVLLAPCGGYLPGGGIWHSQSSESYFAHTPGLIVAMPSTPEDAAALLRCAIAGDDPVLLLLPKHLFRKRVAVFAMHEEEVAFGQARLHRTGTDITIVCWGNTVEITMQAAELLSKNGIETDVVDIRSFVPFDWMGLAQSILKTGRLIVVEEENRTCSFGQSIISEIVSNFQLWKALAVPPQLISRPDVPIGFHPALESAVLPSIEDVVATAKNLISS